MRIPQDLPDAAPTPSFTSEPISTGNTPGDFKPIKLILIGLVFAVLIIFLFSK